jgi:hypothetical protein
MRRSMFCLSGPLFVSILIVVLLSVECGYQLGKYRRSRHEEEKEAPLGAMLGLLAFILAFTFGLAAATVRRAEASVA